MNMLEKYPLKVVWTGKWPCLCRGKWVIEYDGKSLKIPDYRIYKDMNTNGIYSFWHFTDNYDVEYEDIESGLDCDEWIESNREWIEKMFKDAGIKVTEELLTQLFEQINSQDFRMGTCGGCI